MFFSILIDIHSKSLSSGNKATLEMSTPLVQKKKKCQHLLLLLKEIGVIGLNCMIAKDIVDIGKFINFQFNEDTSNMFVVLGS